MLIISRFHDYYDTVTRFGVDKACVYVRKTESSRIKYYEPPIRRYYNGKHHYEVLERVIGFCGSLYPLLIIRKILIEKIIQEKYCYTLLEAVEYFQSENFSDSRAFPNESRIRRDLLLFFEPNTWKALESVFVTKKTPIFLFGDEVDYDRNLVINVELREFQFYRVKDPFTAYQEIYMYLSGVLGQPERKTVEISDKDKAAAYGHDGEYSFKKPPGKKTRWR